MAQVNNLPSWFASATPHARACWLVASHRARTYSEARRMVGRMEPAPATRRPTAPVQNKYWWQE